MASAWAQDSILIAGKNDNSTIEQVKVDNGALRVTTDSQIEVETTIDRLLDSAGIEVLDSTSKNRMGKCTLCGKDKELSIKYKVKMERAICKDCICRKVIDRFFGISIDEQSEEIVYGENK